MKGATQCRAQQGHDTGISIHAPVKGATETCQHHDRRSIYFNPRSREGSDRRLILRLPKPGDFNPRSREGSDLLRDLQQSGQCNFNPRSREGSDIRVVVVRVEAPISIHAPVKGATTMQVEDEAGMLFQSTLP